MLSSWIEANLEAAPGETLDIHGLVDMIVSRSTRAFRREVPDPEAELRRLLPVEGRTIQGYRLRDDMRLTTNGRAPIEGGRSHRPRHKSLWD